MTGTTNTPAASGRIHPGSRPLDPTLPRQAATHLRSLHRSGTPLHSPAPGPHHLAHRHRRRAPDRAVVDHTRRIRRRQAAPSRRVSSPTEPEGLTGCGPSSTTCQPSSDSPPRTGRPESGAPEPGAPEPGSPSPHRHAQRNRPRAPAGPTLRTPRTPRDPKRPGDQARRTTRAHSPARPVPESSAIATCSSVAHAGAHSLAGHQVSHTAS